MENTQEFIKLWLMIPVNEYRAPTEEVSVFPLTGSSYTTLFTFVFAEPSQP